MGFVSYAIAKEFAAKLSLNDSDEWKRYVSINSFINSKYIECPPIPKNIPKDPLKYYSLTHEWIDWDDFLTNRISSRYVSVEDFKLYLNDIDLLGYNEYKFMVHVLLNRSFYITYKGNRIVSKPNNIPNLPLLEYKKIITESDFGKNKIDTIKYWPFEQARQFTRSLNLSSYTDWLMYIMDARLSNNKPLLLPEQPDQYYKVTNDWTSWGNFLNIPNNTISINEPNPQARYYLPYHEAKSFTKTLGLKHQYEWKLYTDCPKSKYYYNYDGNLCIRKPTSIPVNVQKYYSDLGDWISWYDFLGTSEKKQYQLSELSTIAKQNKIKFATEWRTFAKLNNLPIYVDVISPSSSNWVTGEWVDWKYFLGLHHKKTKILSYDEAKQFIKSLKFNTLADFQLWWDKEKPTYIPKNLYRYKKQEHFNINDFFNKSTITKLTGSDDSVCYISRYNNEIHRNVICISVDKNGMYNALNVIEKKNQYLYSMYRLNSDTKMLKQIVDKYCTKYDKGDVNQYIVTDLYELLDDLSNNFDIINTY